MNVLVSKNNNFIVFFNNLGSEHIGFYSSFIIHFIILLFVIGLPNFFERTPINLPNIIPIEIVNISEITSIPEKIEQMEEKETKKTLIETKKFNNSNNQEIKNIETKKFNNSNNQEVKKAETTPNQYAK